MTTVVEQYLATRSSAIRMNFLKNASLNDLSFDLDLSRALIESDLPIQEKIEVLYRTQTPFKAQFEDFLTRGTLAWPQALSVHAIRKWVLDTDCLLWHRLTPLLNFEGTPQRIRYTILEVSPKFAGESVTKISCDASGLEDFSPAYHALLLERCLAYNIENIKAKALANNVVRRNVSDQFPQDKAFLPAITYLSLYDPDSLREVVRNQYFATIWNETAQAWLVDGSDYAESVRKLLLIAFEMHAERSMDHPAVLRERQAYELDTQRLIPPDTLDVSSIEKDLYGLEKVVMKGGFLWRDEYFACLRGSYNYRKLSTEYDDSFWCFMLRASVEPKSVDLNKFAEIARQSAGAFTVKYIHTLGNFVGDDRAVLKLLEFIRSEEDEELIAVATSLASINTQRSLQELVSFIQRSNIKMELKLHVAQLLQDKDLSKLQPELKSATHDLMSTYSSEPLAREVYDLLSQSILFHSKSEGSKDDQQVQLKLDDADIDRFLAHRILRLDILSSEVKRALRTAAFFDMTTRGTAHAESIDLSPLIDMQYKALELYFRERFEEFCNRALSKGTIQRKLDVLGYARPIPSAMDQFESFIGSLPIISEIPFFSKFKLRKLLRGACQFQPGKRFTLDGLKAFGLFFLCFSRKSCRFGLENLLPLKTKNDKELFEFCRDLHVFQDFRNRAAHEGFHPDARADAQNIWSTTARIIELSSKLTEAEPLSQDLNKPPKSRTSISTVVIERRKKVS